VTWKRTSICPVWMKTNCLTSALPVALHERAMRMDSYLRVGVTSFRIGIVLGLIGGFAAETLLAQPSSVRVNSRYTYDMLDPTTNINRKQLLLLDNKRRDEIPDDSVTFGGAVTGIADCHSSNTAGKFGYLMRHPTSNNQVGTKASEAVIHSAQRHWRRWVVGDGSHGTVVRPRAELWRRNDHRPRAQPDPTASRLSPVGRSRQISGLRQLGQDGDTVRSHGHGEPVYGVNRLACVRGTRLRCAGRYSKNGLNLSFMGVQGGPQFGRPIPPSIRPRVRVDSTTTWWTRATP